MIEISTWLGFLSGAGLLYWGLSNGNLLALFLNWHGLVLVVGGTLAALLINAPLPYLLQAWKAFWGIFLRRHCADPNELIRLLIVLSERAKLKGILSLRLDGREQKIAGGFLARAVQVSKEHNNAHFVRLVLEEELNQLHERSVETVNLFRTMAILSPMFGLLGTLLGIIQVLKDLTNPAAVGNSMAMAITSAFYGILLANLVFVPVAGRLRLRNLEEMREREIIVEGMDEILKGSVPLTVMRRLMPFAAKLAGTLEGPVQGGSAAKLEG